MKRTWKPSLRLTPENLIVKCTVLHFPKDRMFGEYFGENVYDHCGKEENKLPQGESCRGSMKNLGEAGPRGDSDSLRSFLHDHSLKKSRLATCHPDPASIRHGLRTPHPSSRAHAGYPPEYLPPQASSAQLPTSQSQQWCPMLQLCLPN